MHAYVCMHVFVCVCVCVLVLVFSHFIISFFDIFLMICGLNLCVVWEVPSAASEQL